MKNAVILHGKEDEDIYFDPNQPSASNFHWLPWLQKQLVVAGFNAQTPDIPHSYRPDYDAWQHEFERFDITAETVLVGHSCGGGFLVRWLSEHPEQSVGRVVLVAPWIDPDHELGPNNDFFTFTIDPDLAKRTTRLTIFDSDNDSSDVRKSIEILRRTIKGVRYRQFENYGHFCVNDMHTERFPELRDEILK